MIMISRGIGNGMSSWEIRLSYVVCIGNHSLAKKGRRGRNGLMPELPDAWVLPSTTLEVVFNTSMPRT
jgi:hypothetical protein